MSSVFKNGVFCTQGLSSVGLASSAPGFESSQRLDMGTPTKNKKEWGFLTTGKIEWSFHVAISIHFLNINYQKKKEKKKAYYTTIFLIPHFNFKVFSRI